MCACVLASVSTVSDLFSLVNVVCNVVVSDSDSVFWFRFVVRMSVLASPPVVLVVTVPFSGVTANVVCLVVFFDSDYELVQPQTFSLQKARSERGFGV